MRFHQGQKTIFPIEFESNPFASLGKDYTDIEEITCNIKKRPSIDSDSEYLESTLSAGQIVVDETEHTFNVTFSQEQTLNVAPGGYLLAFGVKLTGLNNMYLPDIGEVRVNVKQRINRA